MGSNQSTLALKLDLSGKGMKDLLTETKQPHILTAMPKLEHLNLSKNKLSSIPPEIAKDVEKAPKVIEYLQVLNLSKNKFTAIPDCVFLLGPLSFLTPSFFTISL